ncbi:Uncharacterised protein [Enterococcus hirae]|nr:Uncharacterised protein [Enterococcus hirae]
MVNVTRRRGYVYFIQYHRMYKISTQYSISEMKTNKYYIHLLIKCKLQHYISNMIKSLKGLSARRMFIAYT